MAPFPWTEVVSLTVSPAAALGGVWLGKRLEQRAGRDAWRHRIRLEVYARLVRLSNEGVLLADALVETPTEERPSAHRRLRDQYFGIEGAAIEVELVGPQSVKDRAFALRWAHHLMIDGLAGEEWVDHAQAHRDEEGNWPLLDAINEASRAFVAEATKHVGAD